MQIPYSLQGALEARLAESPPTPVAQAAKRLTDRYQSRHATSAVGALTPEEALAYAAVRMPATFGALSAALEAVAQQQPDLAPQSLLDIGAGPGTAIWAARQVFPSVTRATALEREPAMRSLAQRLLNHAQHPLSGRIDWVAEDMTTAPLTAHDLITASYVFGELTPAHREAISRRLWAHARQVLLIVEPGTPDGFARIREIRDLLIDQGARIIAPCPHEGHCPMAEGDWCHFATRIARSKRHRQLKGGDAPYEDEKYAYIAVTGQAVGVRPSRILRHPEIHPGRIRIELCTPDGLSSMTVTKQWRDAFRAARKARWGDAWPADLPLRP